MAVPAKQNLSITRGDTETIVLTMTSDGSTAIDITGRTYRAQIRTTKDATVKAATFTCSVIDAANGEVQCSLTAVQTAALTVGVHYWDLEETDGSNVSTILSGSVNVLADVTR